MYSVVGIQKLSDNQLRKLLKGLPVRVKRGTHHKICLNVLQIKKLNSASKKGKASTITFDPYQCSQHGQGLFGDIARKIYTKGKEFVKNNKGLIKNLAHNGVDRLSTIAHNKINQFGNEEPKGTYAVMPKKSAKGGGFIGDIAGMISKGANLFGLGVARKKNYLPISVAKKSSVRKAPVRKPRKTPVKKGKGFLSNVGRAVLAKAIPVVAEKVAEKIRGGGAKRGRKTTKRTTTKRTTRRAPRKLMGSALYPAGYNGGALMPAGY